MKKNGERISAITAYDYTMASLCDRAGIDIMLVGDSAGMVVLGHDNTARVTMEHMCVFTEAVRRARKNSLIIADMPFMSYQTGAAEAIANSGRLISAGGDAVKLEGGAEMAETIRAIVGVGIPVMGHIGLQPQTTMLTDGCRVQGRTAEAAQKLVEDARALEAAGVFGITLEMVGHQAAAIISESVGVPTIGIGSGAGCDGQVLVVQDMLGMYDRINPKFVKRYGNLAEAITGAVKSYADDVRAGRFPGEENRFSMDEGEAERLNDRLRG